MRAKELRLALICYGGISLAVYMHGITKEIWRMARASQNLHGPNEPVGGTQAIYQQLLRTIASECQLDLRIIVDILAGASAGGINAIFLAEAISTGCSLDPLTRLWLDTADVDRLMDPVSPLSRAAKAAAVPLAWAYTARRSATLNQTVEADHREEIRQKLASFVRGRWFDPPFGGKLFTGLLLDAFDAMAAEPCGPPLLPEHQPLDLFVTVTDFHGHPQRLRLHSPQEVAENEHRLTIAFRDEGGPGRRLADAASLVFAARATASFPGAFPPFRVGELDAVLDDRGQAWPEREAFLARALPRHAAIGDPESAVLIDGSVLANAPFRPAIDALQHRPTRREVDRRFVYIDPKPGMRGIGLSSAGQDETPGFFQTIFGAMSDIPREQPIRDNLEAIEKRSSHIRRLRRIFAAMEPEVEAAIERAFGTTLLLSRPTPARLAAWRAKANGVAARESGFAFAAYGHLKLSAIVEDLAESMLRTEGTGISQRRRRAVREAIWSAVEEGRINDGEAMRAGARPEVITFFRNFDAAFRIRRLRFVARRLSEIDAQGTVPSPTIDQARKGVHDHIGRYRGGAERDAALKDALAELRDSPAEALDRLAGRIDLRARDEEADALFTTVLEPFPKPERRRMILAYLGWPFYDIASLPLLQGEGIDEFDPMKVDRISPDDATAIRDGGAEATLKGIQFNSFGAFFSRAYRENDYLWGRLHGAERMIDITISALGTKHLPAGVAANLKRDAFRAILAEEKDRLRAIGPLFEALEREIG